MIEVAVALCVFAYGEVVSVRAGVTDNVAWAPTDVRRALMLVVTFAPVAVVATSWLLGRLASRHDPGGHALSVPEVRAVIDLREVTCRFESGQRRVVALDEVSVAVDQGCFVAVMGATGSGKSTLLNCAAGLERPSHGSVRLVGRDLAELGPGTRGHRIARSVAVSSSRIWCRSMLLVPV